MCKENIVREMMRTREPVKEQIYKFDWCEIEFILYSFLIAIIPGIPIQSGTEKILMGLFYIIIFVAFILSAGRFLIKAPLVGFQLISNFERKSITGLSSEEFVILKAIKENRFTPELNRIAKKMDKASNLYVFEQIKILSEIEEYKVIHDFYSTEKEKTYEEQIQEESIFAIQRKRNQIVSNIKNKIKTDLESMSKMDLINSELFKEAYVLLDNPEAKMEELDVVERKLKDKIKEYINC